ASHTGVDNIREVVIAGLAFPPARDRYKVFIIDEVHQLSSASFNALLKSIEEPPPHAVFMMATTELHKIPDTILSRSQVFEFRTISPKDITNQLKRIAEIEHIEGSDTAFALIARAAEGSMRDAQSALDQVIAFAGKTVGVDDVSTVLGLVGRDLLMDVIDAVVAEDGPRAFALTERAVESGTDLRLVCRELSQVVRDMMVMTVDPSRVGDAELAPEERERLAVLTREFSKEDLMRAFDLLSTAEQEIRNVSHPRYYFEMILLRWMHLRKLVPLSELLEQMGGAGIKSVPRTVSAPATGKVAPTSAKVAPTSSSVAPASSAIVPTSNKVAPTSSKVAPTSDKVAPTSSAIAPSDKGAPASSLKDALLAEIRSGKGFFYNTVVAQAQKIDVADDRVTFTFLPAHKALREQFDQSRAWLEAAAERLSGRKIVVSAVQAATDNGEPLSSEPKAAAPAGPPKRDLKAEALESTGVQALLDVFPAEIRDVEEM
ncbi:MAG TPA: DNA polymerase III subunit gamma/tau, partial [Vicinamibacterales bacterium]|nr:DNA polymerase III subunit gamma/tau [Vicinamibacterales bacterium]